MLSSDLSHQASVLFAINHFIELSLNFDINDRELVTFLGQLMPAFKAFDQVGIQYSVSIQAFQNVVELVDEARDECILLDYLDQLSLKQIKEIRRTILKYRSLILVEIRQFRDQEKDNQKALLEQVRTIIYDHYQVLLVRVDLGYLRTSMHILILSSDL